MSDKENQQESISSKKYEAIVERLSFAAINEQRRARRWKIFFTFLIFLYFFPAFLLMLEMTDVGLGGSQTSSDEQHTALVQLEGPIMGSESASAIAINGSLNAAFEHEGTKGVILSINSPGGSPVQSAYIYDEMVRLQKEYPDIPLYVVVQDMAASGGYFIASAAKNIYVNKSSLVGSIGVRMGGFSFVDLIDKVGVDRRLITAGENKAMLDPFLPLKTEQREHLDRMLGDVHDHFIQSVKDGRGDRLKQDKDVFSGLIWSGKQAINIGLVDDYGNIDSVAKHVIQAENIMNFTREEMFLDRLATKISVAFSQQIKALLVESIYLK